MGGLTLEKKTIESIYKEAALPNKTSKLFYPRILSHFLFYFFYLTLCRQTHPSRGEEQGWCQSRRLHYISFEFHASLGFWNKYQRQGPKWQRQIFEGQCDLVLSLWWCNWDSKISKTLGIQITYFADLHSPSAACPSSNSSRVRASFVAIWFVFAHIIAGTSVRAFCSFPMMR